MDDGIVLTKRQAGKYLLSKQLLLNPRVDFSGLAGIDSVFRRLGAIQFDPLDPCGNNVDLVLQSRIKNIKRSDYHQWAYTMRRGIEIFHKERCIVPVENVDLARRYYMNGRIRRLNAFVKQYEDDLKRLIDFTEKNGPISAQDVKDKRKLVSGWGVTSSWGTAALNILWQLGELSVVDRHKKRKWYDLTDRAYGVDITSDYPVRSCSPNAEQILGRIDNVGLLPAAGTGQGWLGMGTGKEIKPVLQKLVAKRTLKHVAIQGIKADYLMLQKDMPLLETALKKRAVNKVSFIAPLDNLMWDRKTIKEIFGFDYRWEVYTPIQKRKYGYYVLPILSGDKFIGRIEPVVKPKENILEIKGFWLEKGCAWSAGLSKAFDRYLDHFLSYLGVSDVVWKTDKPK